MTNPATCVYCLDEDKYLIKRVYSNVHEDLYVVECYGCGGKLIPVVIDHFRSIDDVNDACLNAWNTANSPVKG